MKRLKGENDNQRGADKAGAIFERGEREVRANRNIRLYGDVMSQHTFIDLFAGIDGTRLGFEKAGFGCVFKLFL